jgi:4-hydroxyphenylacetate 3-monooxygenase
MQISGTEYLKSLRDKRVVYLGGERIEDVTSHPGFRNAARSFAMMYDVKADPAHRDWLTYEEDSGRHAMYWLRPRSREDLLRRLKAHEYLADLSYGLLGRSPDYFAGFVVGLAMEPEILDTERYKFAQHVVQYYKKCRDNDWFVCNAVTPPPGARKREVYVQRGMTMPTLRVTDEDDRGVILNGAKLLATSAPFAHSLWLGNIQPLAPGLEKEAITCAMPLDTPGLSLWSRKSFELHAVSEFDNPLAYRFDENDCIVICQDVHVPWEDVFLHDDCELSVDLYYRTAAHSMGNHQATVRFRSKLKFLVGLARAIAELSGTIKIPAVQDVLGHLAALDGMIAAMVQGQVHDHERISNGYVNINRRFMYAAIYWCYQNYPKICTQLAELMGGGVMQMPADISVLENPETRTIFETLWSTPEHSATERFKLFKLAWDALGTDFAGRHFLYERFYLGPAFIVRGHNYREAPWQEMLGMVDRMLSSYDVPGFDKIPDKRGGERTLPR